MYKNKNVISIFLLIFLIYVLYVKYDYIYLNTTYKKNIKYV